MDTRPVREGKSAGLIHLVSGVLVVLWGIKSLASPSEIPTWREVQSGFAYQYGGAIVALVVGVLILAVGHFSFRHEAKPGAPTTLVYIYEPPVFLGWVFGIPCILFGVMCLVAIAPYTAERGIVVGQIAAAFFLFLFAAGCAWVFLHYRRTAILDPETQRFQITYGKPWPIKRWRAAFSDYSGISIQQVARKRGYVYRVVAGGEGKKPQLIAFFYSETPAKQAAAEMARTTGWSDLTN